MQWSRDEILTISTITGAIGLGIFFWRRFVGGKICTCKQSMRGKVVVVTGANSGIGKATACELAKREARVVMGCRDVTTGEAAAKDIRRQTSSGQLVIKHLDLGSFNSIREFSAEVKKEEKSVDCLINNAGVFQCPYKLTEDGLEYQMGVNYFGHVMLTNLLKDALCESHGRIIFVSSILMKNGKIDLSNISKEKAEYDKKQTYADSKLAMALYSRELSRQLYEYGVGVFCVSPGIVLTSLGRYVTSPLVHFLLWPLARLLLKSPFQGCQTILHCCLSKDSLTGQFFRNCAPTPWPTAACDDQVASKMYDLTMKMLS